MNHQNDLLRAFEPVATETWHRAIERFLKGKPLEHLDWELEDQLTISPLRRRSNSPAQSLALGRSDNSWHIAEQWTLETPSQLADAQKSILHALQKGVNALVLDWHWLPSQQELAEVLDGEDAKVLKFFEDLLNGEGNSLKRNLDEAESSREKRRRF